MQYSGNPFICTGPPLSRPIACSSLWSVLLITTFYCSLARYVLSNWRYVDASLLLWELGLNIACWSLPAFLLTLLIVQLFCISIVTLELFTAQRETRIWDEYERDSGMITGRERNLPQCHLVHHKSHTTRTGTEPGPWRWEDGGVRLYTIMHALCRIEAGAVPLQNCLTVCIWNPDGYLDWH